MARRQESKSRNQGFGADEEVQIQSTALRLIKQREWVRAITLLASANPNSQKDEQKKIKTVFKQAVIAAENNNELEAIFLHCRLLALAPDHALGMRNLAFLLRRSGHFQDAHYFIKKCLTINPNCSLTLNTLGTILNDLGEYSGAIQAFKKSLSIDPNSACVNNNLANQYHLKAEIDKAFIHSSRSVYLDSERAEMWIDHLTHLRRVCDFDRLEKINWWEIIKLIPPEWLASSFLQVLTLAENQHEQMFLKEAIEGWGAQQHRRAYEQPISEFKKPSIYKDKPFRIGFISADFRDHSVARFIWPLFEHLDRHQFSLYCYSTVQANDKWRAKFNSSATELKDVHDLSPQQLTEVIRNDEIQVLFDLSGFTNGSRTGSLAWRAATVQVGWLGFPGTSGLKAMDYLLLDKHLSPNDPNLITEKSLKIRGTTVCFSQIAEVAITSTIPEVQRGYLTFGSLNNTYKMTRNTIYRWATVLQEFPTSKFLFVRREFQSHLLRQNLLNEFERLGIENNRIYFYNNRLENRHYLDCYNEIDITLDTYPVTGGTTTTDALWMGVPVVGLEGPNIHQRVCSAILHHAGHPEWIAQNDEEFKQIAVELANNQALRIELRKSLRKEMKESLLCDAKKFADDFGECMQKLKSSLE